MALIVSRKERVDPDVADGFRQVERWANSLRWNTPVLAANWANLAPFQPARYLLDPFGFVVVEGLVQFTGTAAAGSETLITTLPPTFAAKLRQAFPPGGTPRVDVYPDGTIKFVNTTGAAIVNPGTTLSGIRYGIFT